jgi:hypothetical protein
VWDSSIHKKERGIFDPQSQGNNEKQVQAPTLEKCFCVRILDLIAQPKETRLGKRGAHVASHTTALSSKISTGIDKTSPG